MTDQRVRTPKPSTPRLFLIGLLTAVAIRGALFFLSFGIFAPGLGWAIFGTHPAVADVIELLITAGLVAAGVYGATGERSARYAYTMGLIFIGDCVAYGVRVPFVYRGEDAPAWLPVVIACTQIPLIIISLLLIDKARKARP